MRRLTLTLALATSLLMAWAAQASACNSGWSRSPNDHKHYYTGADGSSGFAMNGVDAHIYVTNPTVPNVTGTQASNAWVGMWSSNGTSYVLIQEGTEKLKNSGGTVHTFYQIANHSAALWTGCPAPSSCLNQDLAIGSTYDFNVYFQDQHAHFDFAGVEKANIDMSLIAPWANNSIAWVPTVEGEIQSYSDQMPGTAGNQELFSNLLVRRGTSEPRTWFANNNWSTQGYPARDAGATGNLNTFFNTALQGGDEVWLADNCLS